MSAAVIVAIPVGAVLIAAALAALVIRYLAKRSYALNVSLKPVAAAAGTRADVAAKPDVLPGTGISRRQA